MAALPLPGQRPPDPLDPDEVGYRDSRLSDARREAMRHTPETCTKDHCSCHLPMIYMPPELKLTGREALVLGWHLFPLGEDTELSFEEIGQRLGVTRERVRQIYMRAGAKFRAYPGEHYPTNPNHSTPAPDDDETEPTA